MLQGGFYVVRCHGWIDVGVKIIWFFEGSLAEEYGLVKSRALMLSTQIST